VDSWHQAASILHLNGDAIDVAARQGRIVGVRGRAGDRVNRGRLGPKDLFAWQANHSADPLTRPQVRDGSRLIECDSPTAMARVVERSRTLLERVMTPVEGDRSRPQTVHRQYTELHRRHLLRRLKPDVCRAFP
jgi:NADH dehydrogenase/NADH:ubiquinone oxidoreductase subunit G